MIRVPRPDVLPPASERLVVVEASAGTGKTYFLEHRVVDLILGAGAQLGQILLVTFTDKAVAELRLRIRDLLDRVARASEDVPAASTWTLDDAGRAALRAAIASFDRVPIYTIHGFCHRVLVEDAFAARRMFEQTQVADEVAFDLAFEALLRERFARESPDRELLAAYLESGRTVDNLRELLLACTRTNARPHRRGDAAHVIAVAGVLRAAFCDDARRAELTAAVMQDGRDRYVPGWIDQIVDALDRAYAGAAAPTAPRALAAFDETRPIAGKLAARVARAPAHAAVAAALHELVGASSLAETIAVELLPHLVARIARDKAELGQFDYDDMLELVHATLAGPRGPELAARLRARMPWVMIDEFQDTDPIQWEIFRTVWLHPDARGLAIVGDPKQAIYSFRGADVDTYLRARDELLAAGAHRVTLDVNHRSTPQLVDAVNQLLVGNAFAPLLDRDIRYDQPVRASGDVTSTDPRPPVGVFELRAPPKTTADACKAALAVAIADAIEALRARPPEWHGRSAAPFALRQVMVLTRTNTDANEIASALRARALPCAVLEADRLFECREAHELAAVLAAIAAPRDRSARLRALRTRFFAVPWADLMHVVDAPDHHPSIARLHGWAQLAARRAYEPLLRQLVEDSCFVERALVLGGGERAITNTWHLVELLRDELARSRSDLHELVLQLRRWIAGTGELPDDRDVQRAETDSDAIRISTIHKAKGLEAPFVFLYGAAAGGRRGEVKLVREAGTRAFAVGPQPDPIAKRIGDDAVAENQRLAYVALTRAQVRLYLPRYADGVVGDGSTYQAIQRCLVPLVERDAPLFERIAIAVDAERPPPAPADALATFAAPRGPAATAIEPLARARAGLAVMSYTRLARDPDDTSAIDELDVPGAIDPIEFDVDGGGEAAEVGPDDLPPGADSGLLVHDVLERVDLAHVRRAPTFAAWAADADVQDQLAAAARARGIDERFLPHAAQLVHATLAAPLELVDGSQLPPIAAARALAREVEFTYAPPGTRALVRGFIDALACWRDDELWVIDYKTDVLAGGHVGQAARQRVREHYGVQARLYGIAAERMRGGRRLAGLLFAFVRHRVAVALPIGDDTIASWSVWLAQLAARRGAEARS